MRKTWHTDAAARARSSRQTQARPILALLILCLALPVAAAEPESVATFNARFEDVTRRMDGQALAALWEEDGISLLPETSPIIGKPAISAFVDNAIGQIPGARMKSFTLSCADPALSGGLATEWCVEHQVVDLGRGKTFDGRGRMLLVLRRGGDGRWRLLREMWSAAESVPAK
jgi:ketosteroid isomerase-like protein